MRPYLLIAAVVLSANMAQAQSYPQSPQGNYLQQEASVTYPVAQSVYPQPVIQAPAPSTLAPSAYYDARPTDAGQSVVTDVRQMNF